MMLAMIMAASSNVAVAAAAELTAILVMLDSLLLSEFTAILTATGEKQIANVFSGWFK